MKNGMKEKAKELFPWEDEKKKRKPDRMDSIPPGTSLKAKVKSKPPIPGQEYLDLYLMMKEKERLEKFGKTMGKTSFEIAKGWREVRKAVNEAEKYLPSVNEMQGIDEEAPTEEPEKGMPRKIKNMKKIEWSF